MILRCLALLVFWLAALSAAASGRSPDARAARGVITALDVAGDVMIEVRSSRLPLSEGETVPVGAKIITGKNAGAKLALSNGALVCVAGDSELAVQEFFQEPVGTSRFARGAEEPSVSRVKLLLLRGELAGRAPRLLHEQGSSFAVGTIAGELVVRRPGANHGKSDSGLPLSSATALALREHGFRTGTADGAAIFRVVYAPTSVKQGTLLLSNGAGDLGFVIRGGASMEISEGREIEISVTR